MRTETLTIALIALVAAGCQTTRSDTGQNLKAALMQPAAPSKEGDTSITVDEALEMQDRIVVADADNPDNDRVICKKIKQTGSKLTTQKICATKHEWEVRRRQAQEETDRQIRRRVWLPSG